MGPKEILRQPHITDIKGGPVLMSELDDLAEIPDDPEKARQYVRSVVEGYHAVPIATLLSVGSTYSVVSERRSKGELIIKEVESYFRSTGVCYKGFITTTDESRNREHVDTVVNNMDKFLSNIPNHPGIKKIFSETPFITGFLSSMNLAIKQYKRGELRDLDTLIIGSEYSDRRGNSRQMRDLLRMIKEGYGGVLGHIGNLSVSNIPDVDILKIPEDLLEVIKSKSNLSARGIKNLYYGRPGSGLVSLADLEECPEEDFNILALGFIAEAPPGDYFWQRVIRHLFFSTPSAIHLDINPQAFFKNPRFSQKIIRFQKWLGERMILPAFGQPPDTSIDHGIDMALHKFHDINVVWLVGLLRDSFSTGPFVNQLFDPDISTEDTMTDSPLTSLMVSSEELPLTLMDQESLIFLKKNKDRLIANWKERFKDSSQLDSLIEIFNDFVEADETARLIEINSIRLRQGIELTKTAGIYPFRDPEETSKLLNEMWDYLESNVSRLPKEILKPVAVSSEGQGLHTLLGFHMLQFGYHRLEEGKIVIRVTFVDDTSALAEVNIPERSAKWTLPLESDLDQYSQLFELAFLAPTYILVGRLAESTLKESEKREHKVSHKKIDTHKEVSDADEALRRLLDESRDDPSP